MIVTLTRKNGKQRQLRYKRDRLDDNKLLAICNRLKIQSPESNGAHLAGKMTSQDLEFDDGFYYGRKGYEPDVLEITDDQGWYIEFEEAEEDYE